MRKYIKAHTGHSERKNLDFYRDFLVYDRLPIVSAIFDNEEIKQVDRLIDVENKNPDILDYNFYRITTTMNNEYDFENGAFCEYYVAVNHSNLKYWIDTDYTFGNVHEYKIALFTESTNGDNQLVAWTKYKDIGIDTDDSDEKRDEYWEKVDNWIIENVGFLPEYSVN